MFEAFRDQRLALGEIEIAFWRGGEGPPLLLLHGYPQTRLLWRKIAPELAKNFSLVIPDLRGYGESGKPPSSPDHAVYSKRAMALDQARLMETLGYTRFSVAGHDRGGRVAHRLALDHPERIERLAVLDIAPTQEMFGATDQAFATAYYHWFFLIQPAPFPERLIGADPEFFLRWKLDSWSKTPGAIEDSAFRVYLKHFSDPETIRASCEDYRAAAGIDLDHDKADGGRKLLCPLLALWGEKGFVARKFDVLAEWRKRAEDVRGHTVPGGHFLPEEAPAETLAAMLPFFAGQK